jgi:hypothetical protein
MVDHTWCPGDVWERQVALGSIPARWALEILGQETQSIHFSVMFVAGYPVLRITSFKGHQVAMREVV